MMSERVSVVRIQEVWVCDRCSENSGENICVYVCSNCDDSFTVGERIFPFLKNRLKNVLDQYESTESEIQQIYDHIIMELLGADKK